MPAARRKILVVEDEAIIAMLLEQHLVQWGYDVVGVASTGQGALDQVSALRPDLILMDISVKGDLDGIQLAEIVKAEYGIPVVFLTSHSDRKTKAQALDADPAGYLTKPVDETELRAVLSSVLSS